MHHIVIEQQARSHMEDLMAAAAAHRRRDPRARIPSSPLRVRAGRVLVRLGARVAGREAGPTLRHVIPVPCQGTPAEA